MAPPALKFSDDEISTCLLVLAQYRGDAPTARKALKEEHGIVIQTNQLVSWRDHRFHEDYNQLLAEYRDEVVSESGLAQMVRENAQKAVSAEALAIEKTVAMLEANKHPDPARAARDLSQVKSQAVDKARLMEGKPTEYGDPRSIEEVMRALVAAKVLTRADGGS